MADISLLSRVVNGANRNVDLTNNTPVVLSIKIGGGTNTELTKAILDNLITLQNGSDVSAALHHHDGRYFTETEIGSSSASSGSDLVGDDNTYSNFTPAAATVKGALSGINTALGTVGDGKVKVSSNDTTKDFLFNKVETLSGSNVSNFLDAVESNDGSNEKVTFQYDPSKLDHGSIGGLTDDDHVMYTRANGSRAFTGNQSMGSNNLTNVADPVSSQDAATKAYVDGLIEGRSWKQSCKAATTADITLSGAQTIDGISVSTGDRVLVKDQTDATENGIYVASTGAWSRSDDANTNSELLGAAVFVEQGTVNADKQFAQTQDSIIIGTNSITWVVTSANSFSGHDMITLSGGQVSVDLASDAGLESSNPGNAAGQLRVKLDGSTLERSASGLKISAGGVGATELNLGVAGPGLTGGSGSPLEVYLEDTDPSLQITSDKLGIKFDPAGALSKVSAGTKVNVDDSTVEINTNALRVKDLGISTAKLAATSVTAAKLGSDVAGSGLSGGNGSALAVDYAPAVKSESEVAGESFSATTIYAVRYGQNAETAGRMYKADQDASSTDNFYVVGLLKTVGALSAADPMPAITKAGLMTATSHGFTVGKPVFLSSSGALTSTAPSSSNTAVVRVGLVKDANTIDVQIQVVGVN